MATRIGTVVPTRKPLNGDAWSVRPNITHEGVLEGGVFIPNPADMVIQAGDVIAPTGDRVNPTFWVERP